MDNRGANGREIKRGNEVPSDLLTFGTMHACNCTFALGTDKYVQSQAVAVASTRGKSGVGR